MAIYNDQGFAKAHNPQALDEANPTRLVGIRLKQGSTSQGLQPLVIDFATSNVHKFHEARLLMPSMVNLQHFYFEYNEIRSDSLEEIAIDAVKSAYKKLKKPVFVEDSGLFINALNGFPGTYSAWILKKIGNDGLLKLMKDEKNRSARFRACIAFNNGKTIKTFIGECKGHIAQQKCGTSGFGFDPIFIPNGYQRSFAEDIDTKNTLSHRYKALLSFSNFLSGFSH